MTTKLNTDAHARLRAALMEDPAFRAEYERLIEENREPWHGTVGGYTNHGCRGPKCRAAETTYVREYRVRMRQQDSPERASQNTKRHIPSGARK